MLRRAYRALANLLRLPARQKALLEIVQTLGEKQTQLQVSQAQGLEALHRETARLSGQLNSLLARQPARPYYAMGGKWGLTQLSNGQPFFVNRHTRDLTPWIVLGGVWETFVDDLLCALAEPGDCFVDVGANLGYYTVKIGGLVGPEGRVFSFEPNPEMFEILQENVNINGFNARARAFNAAVGSVAGQMNFSVDPSHPGGGMVHRTGEAPNIGCVMTSVPVVTIDETLPDDRSIDLIKIDVEGFEPMVFDGMARALARSPEAAIITEFNTAGWTRFGDPIELLVRYAGERRVLRIFENGSLQEMEPSELADTVKGGLVSYFLILPRTPRRTRQIAAYLKR